MQAIFLAKEKGKYYEMIDAQLTSPYAGKGGMTTGQIVALAEEIGIDPEWMRERLDSSAKRAAVNRLSYKADRPASEARPPWPSARRSSPTVRRPASAGSSNRKCPRRARVQKTTSGSDAPLFSLSVGGLRSVDPPFLSSL